MQVGNEKRTPFWESMWLQGKSPKELAPSLYVIAKFKRRSVFDEMKNDKWISNLVNIHSTEQLEEFTMLFMALSSITLNDDDDTITWKWTANGKYTTSSAYDCQFIGAMTPFSADDAWRAISEPKCQFFAWLGLHNKVLTADNMAKKYWNCDPYCSLCFCKNETTSHLLTVQFYRGSLEFDF
jgi:hypothetical protein